MLLRYFSYVSLITIFIFSSITAQEIGKIFSAKEADEKFGNVIERVEIETSIVKSWIESTNDKIMFNLKGKSFSVLGDSRKVVYSTSKYFETNEEFHMYSKSKLVELLNKGGSSITFLENRKEVFSITNGNITLEYASLCPPECD